jgi:hypothetical protein
MEAVDGLPAGDSYSATLAVVDEADMVPDLKAGLEQVHAWTSYGMSNLRPLTVDVLVAGTPGCQGTPNNGVGSLLLATTSVKCLVHHHGFSIGPNEDGDITSAACSRPGSSRKPAE